MPMNPAHRLVQLGLRSLGYDPGPIDGWYGPTTAGAARGLYEGGPLKTSGWAVKTLADGLRGLGYLNSSNIEAFDVAMKTALGMLLDADGLPAASRVDGDLIFEPNKPILKPVQHGNVMRQGAAGYLVDTFCLHCAAVPGDWHRYKTNREMWNAIYQMHTLPPSRGGRGWSYTGYHSITFPDGERMDARVETRMGAGAVGYNRGVYHHLMIEVGTINKTRLAEDYFTSETLAATKNHIEAISQRTPITRLMGHREVAAKLCPGFDVIDSDWTDRAVV